MRNVTGDPRAGTLEGELSDITPYAGAYVRYFVRHPTTQAMPRKVKTAFAATDEDNAITRIHDVAFIPKLRDGVRGVEMRVSGGTSIMPRLAPTLYEFVELDNGDYLRITEACMRIFDRQEWLRANRARARIKVLVDKIEINAFRELVEEELEGDWVAERDFSLALILFDHDEQPGAPDPPHEYAIPNGDNREFNRAESSVLAAQRSISKLRTAWKQKSGRPWLVLLLRTRSDSDELTPSETLARVGEAVLDAQAAVSLARVTQQAPGEITLEVGIDREPHATTPT